MKKILSVALGSLALGLAVSLPLKAMVVELADPVWGGEKIPQGMQCQKFGGDGPRTPALMISAIPENTNLLIFEYSDESHKPMDNGGHGKFGYALNEPVSQQWVPQVSGHSFELPKGFFMIEQHRNPKWDKAGAYMPPCSGGRNNLYYVTVKAAQVKDDGITIKATQRLDLGRY